jgi:hypothetical protein
VLAQILVVLVVLVQVPHPLGVSQLALVKMLAVSTILLVVVGAVVT